MIKKQDSRGFYFAQNHRQIDKKQKSQLCVFRGSLYWRRLLESEDNLISDAIHCRGEKRGTGAHLSPRLWEKQGMSFRQWMPALWEW